MRIYLSSQEWQDRTPEDWINLSRFHWVGVENRNNYCRDASLGKDATRNRNPHALANFALMRSVSLLLHFRDGYSQECLPSKKKCIACDQQWTSSWPAFEPITKSPERASFDYYFFFAFLAADVLAEAPDDFFAVLLGLDFDFFDFNAEAFFDLLPFFAALD